MRGLWPVRGVVSDGAGLRGGGKGVCTADAADADAAAEAGMSLRVSSAATASGSTPITEAMRSMRAASARLLPVNARAETEGEDG